MARSVTRSHVPPAARSDWRGTWEIRKAQFVKAAWLQMMREPAPLYAYYTKTDGVAWGTLHAVPEGAEPPAGAELITAERIPAGDKRTIAIWFERFAGWLEVIPAEA